MVINGLVDMTHKYMIYNKIQVLRKQIVAYGIFQKEEDYVLDNDY